MDANEPTRETTRKSKPAKIPKAEELAAPDVASEIAVSDESTTPTGELETAEQGVDSGPAVPDRRRIEEQLDALKRKESELRRALAIADHPELAESIRMLEGRAYAITRVEAKMAQGLSKSEERRVETLEKKLGVLRDKRAEIDAQIVEVENQLAPLGAERTLAFETERREALEQLVAALSQHHDALQTAGLEAGSLVPEIARWMPEVVALAETLAANAVPRTIS